MVLASILNFYTTHESAPQAYSRAGKFTKAGENLYRYTSNGIYYGVFRNRGKLIWKSLKTSDKALAKLRLKEEMDKHSRIDPKASKMSLDELLKQYEARLAQLDTKTIATRKSILKVFKESWPHGLTLQVKDVTTSELENWLGQHRQRLKKSSYNEYTRFLRQAFDLALRSKVIAESPPASLKELRRERPIREAPTWEQLDAIIQHIRNQRFNADAAQSGDLVEFMGKAGVGTAEAAHLKAEHIDFRSNQIRLLRKKTDTGFTIPIFPQIRPLLERIRERGELVTGQPVFRVKSPKKALAAACTKLGYPNFSPRSLRRSFITRAIECGVDFKTISASQGHRAGAILIARTCSYLRNEHSDAMALKMVAPPQSSHANGKVG